jgi:hypothetical protein
MRQPGQPDKLFAIYSSGRERGGKGLGGLSSLPMPQQRIDPQEAKLRIVVVTVRDFSNSGQRLFNVTSAKASAYLLEYRSGSVARLAGMLRLGDQRATSQ